jgi:hypothetical protein
MTAMKRGPGSAGGLLMFRYFAPVTSLLLHGLLPQLQGMSQTLEGLKTQLDSLASQVAHTYSHFHPALLTPGQSPLAMHCASSTVFVCHHVKRCGGFVACGDIPLHLLISFFCLCACFAGGKAVQQ